MSTHAAPGSRNSVHYGWVGRQRGLGRLITAPARAFFGLVNALIEARDERRLSRTLPRYNRLDLLVWTSWATCSSNLGASRCCSRS